MIEKGDILFALAESALFEQCLQGLDDELALVAREFGCKYYRSAGRGWPGRRLRCRVGLRSYEIKLLLNPNYLQDQNMHYEIRDQWMYDFGEILTKLLTHRLLATLTSEDLSNAGEIMRFFSTHIAEAMGRDERV